MNRTCDARGLNHTRSPKLWDEHAASIMPVHIESVAGNIPVAIKAPLSYSVSVCAVPCK